MALALFIYAQVPDGSAEDEEPHDRHEADSKAQAPQVLEELLPDEYAEHGGQPIWRRTSQRRPRKKARMLAASSAAKSGPAPPRKVATEGR